MCANEIKFNKYRETAGHLETDEGQHKLHAPGEAAHRPSICHAYQIMHPAPQYSYINHHSIRMGN
jgi:hypothetical protein